MDKTMLKYAVDCIVGHITDEMEDAKTYAKEAAEWADDCKELADLMASLSREEMEHQEKLHAVAVKVIQKFRSEHGEPDEATMAVYNYEHKKHVAKALEVKNAQSLYTR